LARGEGVFVIPKAGSPEHAKENADAAELSLTPDEVARIDRAFPLGPKTHRLPTL
jgi:diketogulonate reductase-like aldo/keto reductase